MIGVTKVFFIELFDILFFIAVNDALYSDSGDSLLELELFLESFHFLLEGQDFIGIGLFIIFGVIVVSLMRGANNVMMFLVTVA